MTTKVFTFSLIRVHTSINNAEISQYNNKPNDKCYLLHVRKPRSFDDKIKIIKKSMFAPDKKLREELVINHIKSLFDSEIKFIYSNRRFIREGQYVNWEIQPLFQFMKEKSITERNFAYGNFINNMCKTLSYIAKQKTFYDEEIIDWICKLISETLQHDFICLRD